MGITEGTAGGAVDVVGGGGATFSMGCAVAGTVRKGGGVGRVCVGEGIIGLWPEVIFTVCFFTETYFLSVNATFTEVTAAMTPKRICMILRRVQ